MSMAVELLATDYCTILKDMRMVGVKTSLSWGIRSLMLGSLRDSASCSGQRRLILPYQ